MFTKKQLQSPSEKQLNYIRVLERKSGLKFYGNTTREAIKFIERAKETIVLNKVINNKLKREIEKFGSL